jgi:hypothetical protein
MKRTLRLFASLGLTLFVSFEASLFASTDGTEQVSVSYAASSPALSLHEPLIVEVRIENVGIEALTRDLHIDLKSRFTVTVSTPDGKTTPPLRLTASGISSWGPRSIAAGGQYLGRLVLNEWYDFGTTGHYGIKIELKNGLKTSTGAALDLPASKIIRVEVTPRSEMRLRAVCEELAATVESASSAQAMLDAAHTLKYVTDPIAVPYMRRVLARTNWVDWILFEGLVRIGTEEAREVLVSAAGEPGERAELARGALARLPLVP